MLDFLTLTLSCFKFSQAILRHDNDIEDLNTHMICSRSLKGVTKSRLWMPNLLKEKGEIVFFFLFFKSTFWPQLKWVLLTWGGFFLHFLSFVTRHIKLSPFLCVDYWNQICAVFKSFCTCSRFMSGIMQPKCRFQPFCTITSALCSCNSISIW